MSLNISLHGVEYTTFESEYEYRKNFERVLL